MSKKEHGSSSAPPPDAADLECERRKPKIAPVAAKIGEGRDNLHRREEWFRRRSDGPR